MTAIVLKVSVVLAMALAAAFVLRRRSAALRHWILASGIVLAAATPPAVMTIPAWHIGGRALSFTVPAAASGAVTTSVTFEPIGARPATAPAAANRGDAALPLATLVRDAWLAGAALWIAALVVGFARLKWLTRDARAIVSGPWFEMAARLSAGIRRPVRLLETRHPTLLVTWGVVRPTIVLPSMASRWPADRIRIVLEHELAHIRRGDWLLQTVAELLRAIYWFNPLAWLAAGGLRRESEYACDDAVLAGGTDARVYASHLLELARALNREPHPWLSAPAMARPSTLEGRVRAMLNPRRNRTSPALWSRLAATLILLGAAAPIAAMSPQATFSTLSGTVRDQTNLGIPGLSVAIVDDAKHEKHEVMTDRSGRYEIAGIAPGDYVLQANMLGFAAFSEPVSIGAGQVQKDVSMHLASLQETIRIVGGSSQPPTIPPADVKARRDAAMARAAARARAAGAWCAGSTNDTGGNLLAPLKLVDVKPIYPEALKGTTGGTVLLDAVIATDGTVRDVRTVSSPDPQLEQAAITAVRQWQFTPTLLNCTAVEVTMHVTTTFLPQR